MYSYKVSLLTVFVCLFVSDKCHFWISQSHGPLRGEMEL